MSGAKRAKGALREGVLPWTLIGVSAAVVLAVVGLVAYDWVAGRDPPDVQVEPDLEGVEPVEGGGFRMAVRIRNAGGAALQDLTITLRQTGDGFDETALMQIPFLAGGEAQVHTVVVGHDPRESQLSWAWAFRAS